MAAKKSNKEKANSKRAKAVRLAKLARVKFLKTESLAEDRHIVTTEQEIHGPLPPLPEDAPLELERETPEAKQNPWYEFWNW
jgi:hypothetical protein